MCKQCTKTNITQYELLTVKCKRQQTKTTLHTKDLIDNSILGSDPTYPSKVAEGGEEKIRKPVPYERDAKGNHEETVPGSVGDFTARPTPVSLITLKTAAILLTLYCKTSQEGGVPH